MLTYISRRVLYSIPVILIASFLLFFVRARDVRPVRPGPRSSKDIDRGRRGAEEQLDLERPDRRRSTGAGSATRSRATSGESARTNDVGHDDGQPALWYTVQLIFWGILVSAIVAISLGVYSAVKQYSVGDYTFTGLSYIGLALPPFWFGLLAIQFLAVGPDGLVQPRGTARSTSSVSTRAARRASTSTTCGTWCCRCMTLTVQIIAEWSRFQRAVDARRDARRLHPHRAGQGRAAAQGRSSSTGCATR